MLLKNNIQWKTTGDVSFQAKNLFSHIASLTNGSLSYFYACNHIHILCTHTRTYIVTNMSTLIKMYKNLCGDLIQYFTEKEIICFDYFSLIVIMTSVWSALCTLLLNYTIYIEKRSHMYTLIKEK